MFLSVFLSVFELFVLRCFVVFLSVFEWFGLVSVFFGWVCVGFECF